MATPMQEVQWSELQRDPKGVAALADNGDVRVKRRDGADLLLTREDRVSAAGEGAFTAARALRKLLAQRTPESLAALVKVFCEEFPWLGVLPQDEVAQFLSDFADATQAAAELGQWAIVTQVLHRWKATAAIYAEPELLERLTAPIVEDHGPVLSPAEGE
jgi:hypothetical protein